MTTAGFEIIEKAKQHGSWTILDEAKALIVTNDLDDEFRKRKKRRIKRFSEKSCFVLYKTICIKQLEET